MKSTVTRPKPKLPKFTEMTFILNREEAILLAVILGNLSSLSSIELTGPIFKAVNEALKEEGERCITLSKEYKETKDKLIRSESKLVW